MQGELTRRRLLSGEIGFDTPAAQGEWHISSAVVSTRPEHRVWVVERLGAMPGIEVSHAAAGKIVILIEGPDSGTLGARLAEIALMDRVLSANMVYEAVDSAPGTEAKGRVA